jgi:TolB-like protein
MGAERSQVSSSGAIVRIRGRVLTGEEGPAYQDASSAVDRTMQGHRLPVLAHSASHVPADREVKEAKGKKGRRKARAAWISFVGRIIAQVVGAAATIILGLYVVNRSGQTSNVKKALAAARSESRVSAPAVRPMGNRSVAVLPLENFSPDGNQQYFADSLTEAVIANLTQVSGLRVISRTSSMVFKGQRKSLPDIAQELGARYVIEGSIARDGDTVRVTAQLIDATRDEHVWAESYERPLGHPLAVQSEVSAAIADGVRKALQAVKELDAGLPVQ